MNEKYIKFMNIFFGVSLVVSLIFAILTLKCG